MSARNNTSSASAAEVTINETDLRGSALIEHRRRKARARKDRRVEQELLWGKKDLPQVGETVVHIATGDFYEVIGFKNEGGERGITLKVRSNDDPGLIRHFVPWSVEPVDADG